MKGAKKHGNKQQDTQRRKQKRPGSCRRAATRRDKHWTKDQDSLLSLAKAHGWTKDIGDMVKGWKEKKERVSQRGGSEGFSFCKKRKRRRDGGLTIALFGQFSWPVCQALHDDVHVFTIGTIIRHKRAGIFGDEEHNALKSLLGVLAQHKCSPVLERGLCDEELCKVAGPCHFAFGSSRSWQFARGQSEKVAPEWRDKGHKQIKGAWVKITFKTRRSPQSAWGFLSVLYFWSGFVGQHNDTKNRSFGKDCVQNTKTAIV